MSFDVSKTGFILPYNWQLKRIGDIADVNARTIKKDNEPQNIHYIDISSVSTGRLETPKLMEYSSAPSRAKRILKEFDIIISTVRPNLRQYVLLQDIGKNWVASTGFCVISPHESSYAWYLYSVITSELFTEHLIRIADGGTYPTFNPKEIENAIIPWPDSDGLKAINHLIGAVEGKINVNIRMNETLEGMAQAIFKSWFVDFDPVRAKVDALEGGGSDDDARLAAMQAISGKSPEDLAHLKTLNPKSYAELAATADAFPAAFTTSPLGDIPEGWDVRLLSQEIDVLNGCAFKSQDYVEKGIFVLRTKNFNDRNETEKLHDDVFLPDEFLSSHEKYIVQAYDYHLIMVGASVGNRGLVYPCHLPALRNQNMWCFRAKEDSIVTQLFTKYLLDSLIKKSSGLASGSAREFFRKGDFEDENICVGNKAIQDFFFKNFMPILEKMAKIADENMTLVETRDALLPKLLSGGIDVSGISDTEAA